MELPYEREAMRGAKLPEGLTLTDSKMFLALRSLYSQYQSGAVSREQASAEKQTLLRAYEADQKLDGLIKHHAKLRTAINNAVDAYMLDKTIENADALIAVVDGSGLGSEFRSEQA